MRIKILLIGPLPPPMGGVSVHVSRLQNMINASSDLECAVFDIGKMKFNDKTNTGKSLIKALLFFLSASIVHIHISHPRKVFVAKIAKIFGKKIIYTQHNIREERSEATLKLHKIANAAIKVYKSQIELLDFKTIVIPAYIPATSITPLQQDVKEQFSKYKTVIAAISTHPKNRSVLIDKNDIYGFDLLLKAYPDFFRTGHVLLLMDASGTMKDVNKTTVESLNERGFPVIYLTSEVDFNALLPFISVFVRPTRSDGDSIAIREALACGIKVLASDCIARPERTVLFKTDDEVSLAKEIAKLIDSPNLERIAQEDYSEKILAVYRSL